MTSVGKTRRRNHESHFEKLAIPLRIGKMKHLSDGKVQLVVFSPDGLLRFLEGNNYTDINHITLFQEQLVYIAMICNSKNNSVKFHTFPT